MLTDNFYSPQGPPGGGGPPGTPIMPSPAGTEIYLKIKKLSEILGGTQIIFLIKNQTTTLFGLYFLYQVYFPCLLTSPASTRRAGKFPNWP